VPSRAVPSGAPHVAVRSSSAGQCASRPGPGHGSREARDAPMTIGLLALLTAAVLLLATIGAASFLLGTWEEQSIVHRERPLLRRVRVRAAVFGPLERLLIRIPQVRRLRILMVQANVRSIRVSECLVGGLLVALVVTAALAQIMAVHWALALGLASFASLVYALTLLHQRQR